jgi:acetyl esterase
MPQVQGTVDVFDESYVRHGDRSLLVRIYSPRGPGPFPTLLSVHGGVWNSGSRDSNASLDKAIATRGVLVVAADFRQPPLGGYPESIADLNLAARWVQANASRFRGRADRIGGLGTSSGGHQLLLNALRPRDPRYTALPLTQSATQPAPSQVLQHIALCWPIVDPLGRYRWARRTNLLKLVLSHERYWGDEAAMADGSPQLILDRREQGPATLPDLLVIQGTADENIPAGATERFVESYLAAGGQADLHMFADMPHGFITRDASQHQSLDAIELITSFIASQSAGSPAIDTARAS